MSKKGQKKKRPSEYLHKPVNPEINVVSGDRCVCCGKVLSPEFSALHMTVRTRSFPVCSKECREEAEEYVRRDRRGKTFLYLLLFLASVSILIGSVVHDSSLFLYPAVCAAGVGLIVFPYPITSFETFFSCPIRRTTLVCRILGGVLVALGIFFFVYARIVR